MTEVPAGHTWRVSGTEATLAAVTDRLAMAGCVAAEMEAAEFLAAAVDASTLEEWLRRREQGEPSAWITGQLQFCDQVLQVTPGVYVPRAQSEELACRAAALLPDHGRAVDLCTGTGAIAAHLQAEVPTATVLGTDLDMKSAACARHNGVPSVVADLAEPPCGNQQYDVVTAVPPYVPTGDLQYLPADVQRYEPRLALDGGADGLDLARKVVASAADLLRPGGWLLMEVGGAHDEVLAPTLATHAFHHVIPWHDEDGDLRGLAARAT